jgi:hypothetical protein
MKNLLVWALLACVPFSSLRMVCLNADSTGVRPAAGSVQAKASGDDDECSRICKRRPSPPPKASCFLIADPACAFVATAVAAILPGEAPFSIGRVATPLEPGTGGSYIAPPLVRRSPPPKP